MSVESVVLSNPISSSATLFFCLQSFPASGSLPMGQFLVSGSKVLELQLQDTPSSEYSGLISLRIDFLIKIEKDDDLHFTY